MEKYLDRVNEAYFGTLGTSMAEKTRNRIHWIIKNAIGENVLDIGCSQGITSLLLGREGKNVLGIDIAQEAIDYANETLSKEQENVQNKVRFLKGDFLNEDLSNEKFDTIIITEVLEHFISSTDMIKKAHGLLRDDGFLVVTVPFGINDFPDHKRTLYLSEIYKELSPHFNVSDVEFLGKWIGFVSRKSKQVEYTDISIDLIEQSEKAFYNIERDLITKNDNLKRQNLKYKDEIQKLKLNYDKLQEQFNLLNNENANLKFKVEFFDKNPNSYEPIMENLNVVNTKLSQEYKEIISQLKSDQMLKQKEQNEDIKRLTNELKEKQTIMQGLQNNSNQLQEKLSLLTVKFNFEKEYFDELKIENNELKTEVKTLKQEFQRVNRELDGKIKSVLTSYKQKEQQLKDELVKKEEVNKSLVKINGNVDQENQRLNDIKEDMTKRLRNLQDNNKKLAEDLFAAQSGAEQREYSEIKKLKVLIEKEKEISTRSLENTNRLFLENQILENRNKVDNLKLKEELLDYTITVEKMTKQLIIKEKRIENLQHKYNSLKNSKLGKLTLKYWSLKNRTHK